ncbi:hypothetical protein BGZ49_006961 [Haplosporangium sp. Z 27]|nr:hypothetical protein BGZ49_006961 [Haplosporangium sp. Z 27]
MKVQCMAMIFIHKSKGFYPLNLDYSDKSSKRRVRILYYYHRSGLGQAEDLQYQYLSEGAKFQIEHCVKLGLDKQATRRKLTSSQSEIQNKITTLKPIKKIRIMVRGADAEETKKLQ